MSAKQATSWRLAQRDAMYVVTQKVTLPAHTTGWGENRRDWPERTELVQFEFDLDAIYRRYGSTAMQNRTGRTTALSGLLKARVLKKRAKK